MKKFLVVGLTQFVVVSVNLQTAINFPKCKHFIIFFKFHSKSNFQNHIYLKLNYSKSKLIHNQLVFHEKFILVIIPVLNHHFYRLSTETIFTCQLPKL